MQTTVVETGHDGSAEFRQLTHLVLGYGTLIGRALDAAEDPRPLLDALISAVEHATRSAEPAN